MPENERANKQTLNTWLPLVFSLVIVIGMIIGARLSESMSPEPGTSQNSRKIVPLRQPGTLEELVRFIDARYVDDVDVNELSEDAINYLLDQLDPHSAYISADKVAAIREQLGGSFVGVGLEFLIIDDTIAVMKPTAEGPAENAGIVSGDQIIYINDSLVAGQGYSASDLMDLFRGERGTFAELLIKRENADSLMKFEISRDDIQLPSVDVAYEIVPDVGYIKLSRFSSETSAEFIQSLERLVEQEDVKKIVLDLRDNPGGYLQEAVEILSQLFTEKDRLLVYTEGDKSSRLEYKTTGRPFYFIEDIAVLVNENSASASEIIAGAIQDWDRGYIIGRRSFGKGLVQEEYNLKDGSALRLTVARYFTPSGRSIQKNYDLGEDQYNGDFNRRWSNGELFVYDSIKVVDSLAFSTPSGRVVYGGGGIKPDYFIALDSLVMNDNFIAMRPYFQEYAYRYFIDQQASLDFESAEDFQKNFFISDSIIADFVSYVKEKGVNKLVEINNDTKDYVKNYLKSQVALLKYDVVAQYVELNQKDDFVNRALQLLKDSVPIAKLK